MKEELRIGICKHTGRKLLQVKDENSDDAIDEKGWLCLHDESEEEEIQTLIKFKYNINLKILNN